MRRLSYKTSLGPTLNWVVALFKQAVIYTCFKRNRQSWHPKYQERTNVRFMNIMSHGANSNLGQMSTFVICSTHYSFYSENKLIQYKLSISESPVQRVMGCVKQTSQRMTSEHTKITNKKDEKMPFPNKVQSELEIDCNKGFRTFFSSHLMHCIFPTCSFRRVGHRPP